MTEGTEAITTIHFTWIGLLALLVLIAIAAGIRKARARAEARREVEARAAEAGVEIAPPAGEERSSPPIAPAPPPIADQPALGTPPPLDGPAPRSPADAPIATALAPDGTTAAIAADAAGPEEPSPAAGPVTQLKGLGPRVAARLSELGIERVGQLATLDERGAEALDAELGPFTGRMARDRWIEQARLLAAGDRAGFERVFGNL